MESLLTPFFGRTLSWNLIVWAAPGAVLGTGLTATRWFCSKLFLIASTVFAEGSA